jgi:hypothetical protein
VKGESIFWKDFFKFDRGVGVWWEKGVPEMKKYSTTSVVE